MDFKGYLNSLNNFREELKREANPKRSSRQSSSKSDGSTRQTFAKGGNVKHRKRFMMGGDSDEDEGSSTTHMTGGADEGIRLTPHPSLLGDNRGNVSPAPSSSEPVARKKRKHGELPGIGFQPLKGLSFRSKGPIAPMKVEREKIPSPSSSSSSSASTKDLLDFLSSYKKPTEKSKSTSLSSTQSSLPRPEPRKKIRGVPQPQNITHATLPASVERSKPKSGSPSSSSSSSLTSSSSRSPSPFTSRDRISQNFQPGKFEVHFGHTPTTSYDKSPEAEGGLNPFYDGAENEAEQRFGAGSYKKSSSGKRRKKQITSHSKAGMNNEGFNTLHKYLNSPDIMAKRKAGKPIDYDIPNDTPTHKSTSIDIPREGQVKTYPRQKKTIRLQAIKEEGVAPGLINHLTYIKGNKPFGRGYFKKGKREK